MTRDYKKSDRRQRTAPPTPGWVWLLIGLIPGLLIALMVYLGGYTADGKPGPMDAASLNRPDQSQTDARSVRKTAEPKPLPTPVTTRPRFDFYTILPEMEVAIPEQNLTGKPVKGLPQVEKAGTYILQAGSFKSFPEADRLKASLILLGIEATIQTITVNNKDTWHRVHIGPYKELAELNLIRARLKQNRIDAVLLKVKT